MPSYTLAWKTHTVSETFIINELIFLSSSVNVVAYCETLKLLRTVIKHKLPGKLGKKVVLLRDNARPYSMVWHGSCYINFSGKNRNIHRVHSLAIPSYDFYGFGRMKKDVARKHFNPHKRRKQTENSLRRYIEKI